jgi:antitoxin MazE
MQYRHKTLEERAVEYGGELPLDGEFDYGEQVGREIW